MKKCKVVQISSVHKPSDIRIFHKECISLVRNGYDVTLIAPANSYEMNSDVRVKTVRKPNGRFQRMVVTQLRIFYEALKEWATIYHFHDPELIPTGIALRLMGRRVIYDVHEDLPQQVLGKDWIPRCLRNIISKAVGLVEYIAAFILSAIVAATPAISKNFPKKKTVNINNYPILGELVSEKECRYAERLPLVAYVGGLGEANGIKQMVEAMSLLRAPLNAKLLIAGTFDDRLLYEEVKKHEGWRRVNHLGWLNRSEIKVLLNKVRVGLVLYHLVPNSLEAQPNKLYEYMYAGIPVIASKQPHWCEIVDEAGILVDPLDPRAIADAIEYIFLNPKEAEEMGRCGHEIVTLRYHWGTEERKLLNLYHKLATNM